MNIKGKKMDKIEIISPLEKVLLEFSKMAVQLENISIYRKS